MIQSTMDRLIDLCEPEHRLVVTNRNLIDPLAEQLPDLPRDHFIGEPCKRDTAPCIGLAAHWVAQRDPHGVMLVVPADHLIQSTSEFQDAVRRAADLIEADPSRLVLFGIRPSYPADSFGYIERDAAPRGAGAGIYRVKRFCEKPDRQTAARFLKAGGFYWNAGIFLWRVDAIQAALRQFEPAMFAHLSRIGEAWNAAEFDAVLEREFTAIQPKSIDYAVLERHDNVWMIEAPFDWDDVGNWTALPRLVGRNDEGNTVQATHVGIDTHDTIIRGPGGHLIVTVGIRDCIIVQTADATLIADRTEEERIREVVRALEERGLQDYL
jgi:mannose-1-phosphate guanylyltransferase